MYYYWHGGDLQKVEKEFFKGITLKGKYDVVENAFLAASELDPNRLDLQFGLASTQIIQRKVPEALATYKAIIARNPKDFQAHMLLAAYSLATKDAQTYAASMEAMRTVYPEMTAAFEERFHRVDAIMNLPFGMEAEAVSTPNHAIVILGYALADDGSMREPLIGRLEQGLALARKNPGSPIIVSGGVPKGGVTEAYLMKRWLTERGIPGDKIYIEDQAKDTVGNALYSVAILKQLGIQNVTLITSASHMRRALSVFTEMAVSESLDLQTLDNLVYLDYPSMEEARVVSDNEALVIYRDMARASGIWAYPGIQR